MGEKVLNDSGITGKENIKIVCLKSSVESGKCIDRTGGNFEVNVANEINAVIGRLKMIFDNKSGGK